MDSPCCSCKLTRVRAPKAKRTTPPPASTVSSSRPQLLVVLTAAVAFSIGIAAVSRANSMFSWLGLFITQDTLVCRAYWPVCMTVVGTVIVCPPRGRCSPPAFSSVFHSLAGPPSTRAAPLCHQIWTILQHSGPDCLGLWFIGISSHMMAHGR